MQMQDENHHSRWMEWVRARVSEWGWMKWMKYCRSQRLGLESRANFKTNRIRRLSGSILANPHINHKHIDSWKAKQHVWANKHQKNQRKPHKINALFYSDYNIFLNIQIFIIYIIIALRSFSLVRFFFKCLKNKSLMLTKAYWFETFLIIINVENSCAAYFYFILFYFWKKPLFIYLFFRIW